MTSNGFPVPMAYVYLLTCSDGSFYVGSCRNLEHRLWQHERGIGCDYTRGRRPVRLVWSAELPTVVEAYGMERRIHGWSRAKKQALIDGRFEDLRALSRGGDPSTSSGSVGGASSGFDDDSILGP